MVNNSRDFFWSLFHSFVTNDRIGAFCGPRGILCTLNKLNVLLNLSLSGFNDFFFEERKELSACAFVGCCYPLIVFNFNGQFESFSPVFTVVTAARRGRGPAPGLG